MNLPGEVCKAAASGKRVSQRSKEWQRCHCWFYRSQLWP